MKDLPDILNWRRWDKWVTMSGQPTEQQLADIRGLGVENIINLGPHTNRGALSDEAGSVEKLGMTYIYIPVDFDNPTEEDFIKFCDALVNTKDQMTHVHCIYNARVSAFFYRYANSGKGGSAKKAHATMDSIWRPGGVWAEFIGDSSSINRSNRYAGEDY